MKPRFSDLTQEQKESFGDGCTYVPDFIFTANCRQHDYSYIRGYSIKDKLKADWDMARHMWHDSSKLWHYLITAAYWCGLTLLPFSYFFFEWGSQYPSNEEILKRDEEIKRSRMI